MTDTKTTPFWMIGSHEVPTPALGGTSCLYFVEVDSEQDFPVEAQTYRDEIAARKAALKSGLQSNLERDWRRI